MRLLLFISILVFLPGFLFAQKGEKAILSSIHRYLHQDFSKVDSVIRVNRDRISHFSEDGKFEFLLYDLAYKITTREFDQGKFSGYLDTLKIREHDRMILQQIGGALNDEVFYFEAFDSDETSELTPGRSALISVLDGYKEEEESLIIDKFDRALKLSRKSSLTILPSLVFSLITEKYKAIGNYKEAVKYYQKAINYSRDKKHSLCVLQFSLSMALIQFEMDNLKKAEDFFKKSSKLAEEINDSWERASSLRGLGNIHLKQNEYEKGVNNFQRALVLYYQVASDLGIAQTHKDIGKAYLLGGDKQLAERNFKLSKTYYDKITNSEEGEDELYENFAALRLSQNRYNEALHLINLAIDLRKKESGSRLELYESYEIRSRINAGLGLGNNAYQDLIVYSKFKDSLYSANLQQQIAELSELYESEQKSKQIFEQEQRIKEERNERLLREKQLENTQLRNRQIILIFSFSILLLLAIIFIVYFKNKQRQLKRKQTEIELRQQLLRSQMNPHFVFNAMSVIQSYIYDNDTEKSSQFLVSLSRLMRLILENSSKETIKLRTELEILERFLFIQQERFENRFSFEIEPLSKIDIDQVSIPPMILQPFLENATEHGELDKVINGKIRITYKIENQLLIFVVEDNGIGRKAAQNKGSRSRARDHKSLAISITKRRIELMRQKYNKQGFIKIEDLDKQKESGTKVTVAMPLINK